MAKQYVHVSQDISEVPQPVDQNVLPIPNVVKLKLVVIKNAEIHVQEHVELVQNVPSLITIQFAVVYQNIQAIHLLDVALSVRVSHHNCTSNYILTY